MGLTMPMCYGMFFGQRDRQSAKSQPPRKSNVGRGFHPKKKAKR